MTAFEYYIEVCEHTLLSEKRLNKLGKEGWELTVEDHREMFLRSEPQGRRKIVHYSPVKVRFYYFKRPVDVFSPPRPSQSVSPNLMWGVGSPWKGSL
ncbi:unnamed protein product [marine sediment metagenome]|uniref:Uncharacterized protein n=1 Tax=marine sediment metagenome TaxID=412755 RepID=X0RRX3_9ZZZZ